MMTSSISRATESLSRFVYTAAPARVIFGSGTIDCIAEETARLKLERVLVLATEHQAAQAVDIAKRLGTRSAGVFCDAKMHTPVEVTGLAVGQVERDAIDGLLAIGGGSAIGLAKAIAVRTNLPQIAMPTTYAGSEMTPILGETENGLKTTRRISKALPDVVIYDVDLTMSLPSALSVVSGINAMAHAVEALYARDRNPIISMMAGEEIRALAKALPIIAADPGDRAARTDALHGAWLCGTCLGAVGMALHHKLCHTLGGTYDLPHAETHTVILPHAMAYNAPAAPEAMSIVAAALGRSDAAGGLYDLALTLGAPVALRDLGMSSKWIDAATDAALKNSYWNPRPLDRGSIRDLHRQRPCGQPSRLVGRKSRHDRRTGES